MAGTKSPQSGDSSGVFTENYREFQKRRARFEEIDNDINQSAARLMKSMADVAEKKPEEFFGLKATEREIFVLNKLIDPSVIRAFGEGRSTGRNDIVGGQEGSEEPGFFGGLVDKLLKKIDIVELIKGLIKDEKEYWLGQNKEEGDKTEGEQRQQ